MKPPLLGKKKIWAIIEEAEQECDADLKLDRAVHEYRKLVRAQWESDNKWFIERVEGIPKPYIDMGAWAEGFNEAIQAMIKELSDG